MRVGIHTHYAHCDQAYLALRLVEFLRQSGIDFDLYSDRPPAKLRSPYDRVVAHRGVTRFTDWAQKQTTVIWTHVPKIEQINYVNRLKKGTVLAPMWQELIPPFRKAMKRADSVVAMTTECHELYKDVYKLQNVLLIPYDTGLPITRKDTRVNHRSVKILLPWFDRNARCATSDFLRALGFLLERMPDAALTVAITSSRFSPAIAKFFQTLSEKTSGRVSLVRRASLQDRLHLFTEHDLTFYPAECDNFGHCLLTSITCGTPVLTFALSPQLDFVYQDANGVLIRTKTDFDENGVPHAIPAYEEILSALQTLIAEPRHIDNLNSRITYNLSARRKSFELGWRAALGLG